MASKFISDGGQITSNKNMVCKDCIKRNDKDSGTCKVYKMGKPYKVLDGGKCAEKKSLH